MQTRALPDALFDRVRASDAAGIAALFAPQGRVLLPTGQELCGRAEIAAWYGERMAREPLRPTLTSRAGQGRLMAVEIEALQNDGSVRRAADFLHLDEAGRIERLVIYSRP